MTDLIIASHRDVISWGWNGEQLLTRLIELDNKHIPGMDAVDEGSALQWAPVFMQHPHTWALLVNPNGPASTDSVVGYWSFCTLRPESFQEALTGQLNDSQIAASSLQPISGPGEYDAYIVMFVVDQSFRKPGALMLVRSFFANLLTLARQGVFMRRLCANIFTPEGGKLAAILGLEHRVAHSKRGEMYARTLAPSSDKLFSASFAELNRLYHHRTDLQPSDLPKSGSVHLGIREDALLSA